MEAIPRLPMLSFDLKRSPEYVEFGPVLKQYIKTFYGEDPSGYNKACSELEQLRQDATQVVCDYMGCTTLKKYFAQLQFLQGRFPMGEGEDAAIAFTWEDVQTGRDHVGDIRFEQAAILYNIGSLHSLLGVLDTRHNAEGMKISCTHFQCAAWAFEYLRDNFGISSISTDMSYELLSFHILLMLAQAQECILEKSMLDGRKNSITAKVAAQVVEFYRQAITSIDVSNQKQQINSRLHKDWRRRMEMKEVFYQCITYYYQGQQMSEAEKPGECLAYFTGARDKLNEALKQAKNEVSEVTECLQRCQEVVVARYNSAKKDNDFVYHDRVPALDSLPEIKGASLVKGIPFNPTDKEISGPHIFHKLVPLEAHQTSSVYSEEKAKLARTLNGEIEEKDMELNQFMSSIQLDIDQFMPKVDTIPESLMEKCAAMSVRTNAIKELTDSMAGVSGLATEVELAINETQELIDQDTTKTEHFEEQYGRKKPNTVLPGLLKELDKFREQHKEATQLNNTLYRAMNAHTNNLKTLILAPVEVEKLLPRSTPELSPEEEAILTEITGLMRKVTMMKEQRKELQDKFREQIQNDDITNVILTLEGKDKEAIFEEQLKKHDETVKLLRQNMTAQDNILRALTDANAKFALIRQAFGEAKERRQSKVDDLILSYEKYEELLAKSQRGEDYNRKLLEKVTKTLERSKSECKVRQEEREMLVAQFAPRVPAPSRPMAPKPGSSSSVPSTPSGDPSTLTPPTFATQPQVPAVNPVAPDMTPETFDPAMPASFQSLPTDFEGPKLKDYLPFMKPRSFGPKSGDSASVPPTTSPGAPPPELPQPPMDYSDATGKIVPGLDPSLSSILPATIAQYLASVSASSTSSSPMSSARHTPSPQSSGTFPHPSLSQHPLPRAPSPSQSPHASPSRMSQYATPYAPNAPGSLPASTAPMPGLPHQSVSTYSGSGIGHGGLPASSALGSTAALTAQYAPNHHQQQQQQYFSTTPSTAQTANHPQQIPPQPYTPAGQYHANQQQPGYAHPYPASSVPAKQGVAESLPAQAQARMPSQPQLQQQQQHPMYNNQQLPGLQNQQSLPPSQTPQPNAARPTVPLAIQQQHHQQPQQQQQQQRFQAPQPHPNFQQQQQQQQQHPQHQQQQQFHPQMQSQTNPQWPATSNNAFSTSNTVPTPSHPQGAPGQTTHNNQQLPRAQFLMQQQPLRPPHQPQQSQGMPLPGGGGYQQQQQIHQGPRQGQPNQALPQQTPATAGQNVPGQQFNQPQAHQQPSGMNRTMPTGVAQQTLQSQTQPLPHLQGQPQPIQGQPMHYQGQSMQWQGQTMQPQGHPMRPQGQLTQPQGQPMQPQGQPMQPQGQPLQPQNQHIIRPSGQQLPPQSQQMLPQSQQQIRPQSKPMQPRGHSQQTQPGPTTQLQGPTTLPPSQGHAGQLPQGQPSYGQGQQAAPAQDQNVQRPTPTGSPYCSPVRNALNPTQPAAGPGALGASTTTTTAATHPSHPTFQQQQQQHPGMTTAARNQSFVPANQHTQQQQQQPGTGSAPVGIGSDVNQSHVRPHSGGLSSNEPSANLAGQRPTAYGSASQQQQQQQQQQPFAFNPSGYPSTMQPTNSAQPTAAGKTAAQAPSSSSFPAQQQTPLPGGGVGGAVAGHPQAGSSNQWMAAPYSQPLPNTPNVSQASSTQFQPSQQFTSQQQCRDQRPSLTLKTSVPSQPCTPTSTPLPQESAMSSLPLMVPPSPQPSSLDEILSSSPNGVKDRVIAPQVLTDQERQLQKEEAMKNQTNVPATEPYSGQGALLKLAGDVDAFSKHIDDLSITILGVSRLDSLWKNLLDNQDTQTKKTSMAIARCYPMKNRDPDIMPYDDTRVVLKSTKDDYINASWLNDLAPSCPKFIITQAPLPVTVVEFWTMVYEQGSEVVVQITSEYETGKKFPLYYPTEKDKSMEHGPMLISLQSVKFRQNWVERILYMKNTVTKQGRTVVHLLFKGWPVSGFPDDVKSIVSFISEVHSFYKQQRNLTKPIIVHCGTGVGRSGVFALAYSAIQELLHGSGLVDLPGLSKRILQKRRGILLKKEQLCYAYKALLCFAEDYLSKRGIPVNNPHFVKAPSESKEPSKDAHSTQPSHAADDIVFGSMDIEAIRENVGRFHIGRDKDRSKKSPDDVVSDPPSNSSMNNLTGLPDVVQQPSETCLQVASKDQERQSESSEQRNYSKESLGTSVSSIVKSPSSSLDDMDILSNVSRGLGSTEKLHSDNVKGEPMKPPHDASTSSSLSSSLAQLQDPATFTMGSPEKRNRITKTSFGQDEDALIRRGSNDAADPLASLDPLWSLGK